MMTAEQMAGSRLHDPHRRHHRFVAEFDEIASFVGPGHSESAMLSAAARLYEGIARDFEGEKKEIGEIDAFLKT